MRTVFALLVATLALALGGCSSPGDVSRAAVTLGDSAVFSRADLQAAADAVLVQFREFEGCTLQRLVYDENFSTRQIALASQPRPHEDVVVFTSQFRVGPNGQRSGLNPDSTYGAWTWTVTRADASATWTVTSWGAG
ncbi:MAG: hypothetical protein QM779_05725 [Propionicimonas sp.]|uniref:hypothetical protein n=1 Tax=Propionicimonas sp. TaxID=1955623 RepID=UPI003D0E69A1